MEYIMTLLYEMEDAAVEYGKHPIGNGKKLDEARQALIEAIKGEMKYA